MESIFKKIYDIRVYERVYERECFSGFNKVIFIAILLYFNGVALSMFYCIKQLLLTVTFLGVREPFLIDRAFFFNMSACSSL